MNSRLLLYRFSLALLIFLAGCHEEGVTGRQALVLSGGLSDKEAAEIIATDVGSSTQEIKIISCPNLTTLDLHRIQRLNRIEIVDNGALKTIDLSGLTSVTGMLRIRNAPALESLNFDALREIHLIEGGEMTSGGSYHKISNTNLKELSFPSLTRIRLVGMTLGFDIANTQLASISFPELTEIESDIDLYGISIGNYSDGGHQVLLNVDLPKLTKVSGFIDLGGAASISVPEFVQGDIRIRGGSMTAISIPKMTTGNFTFTDVGSITILALPEFTQGDVTVACPQLTTLTLPKYTTGRLEVENTALSSFTIPEMTEGNIRFNILSSASVTFPKLVKADEIMVSSLSSSLLSLSFPELQEVSKLMAGEGVSSLALPKLAKATDFITIQRSALVSLLLPELKEINADGGYINDLAPLGIRYNASLTSIDLPRLPSYAYQYQVTGNSSLKSVSLSSVTEGYIQLDEPITTLSAPRLARGGIYLYNTAITSLSFPEFREGSVDIENNNDMSSLDLPKFTAPTTMSLKGNSALSSVTLPLFTSFPTLQYGQTFQILGSRLSSTSINAILANLVQVTPAVTGLWISLHMNPSAPPTGQGIIDKATLAGKNFVETD